jgi:methyl acetate hydrolase
MSLPTPTLDAAGKSALDAHLQKTLKERKVPATWLGVTTAEKELFFDYGGERVFGKPEEGLVDEHTGELECDV